MKEYRIQKIYDDDLFTDIVKITQVKDGKIMLSVGPKEGNLMDTLKSKLQKEFLLYSGYLENEIGRLRSNIGLASNWTVEIDGKQVAKAEIKGIQYFTINLKDRKENFSGKSTSLTEIELTKGRDFSSCITLKQESDDGLDVLATLECKISPEALIAFGVALDNKFLFEDD